MMISTKGKYALQTMIDLAQQARLCACEDTECTCVSLKAIAERQNISMKYLESIAALLNRGGLVKSTRGKDGGYRLTREPEGYTIGSILKLTEGSLAAVSCTDAASRSTVTSGQTSGKGMLQTGEWKPRMFCMAVLMTRTEPPAFTTAYGMSTTVRNMR